jgi:hypothetical protein
MSVHYKDIAIKCCNKKGPYKMVVSIVVVMIIQQLLYNDRVMGT